MSIYLRTIAMTLVFFVLLIPQVVVPTCEAKSPPEEGLQVTFNNNLISLDANNARLAEVLSQIASKAAIEIRTGGEVHSLITLSGRDLSLASLMKKIHPNFMFIEESGQNGALTRKLYLFGKSSAQMPELPRATLSETSAKARPDQRDYALAANGSGQYQKDANGGSAGLRPAEHKPDELLVRFRSEVTPAEIEALNGQYGATVVKRIAQVNVYQLKFPAGSDLPAMEQAYRQSTLIEKTEMNQLLRLPKAIPNDAELGAQWGLQKMMVPEAWNITTGSSSVVVAILDTGVDANHLDLIDRIVPGYDFVNGKAGIPDDDYGHGTQMAGIIAGEGINGAGISGVNLKCTVLPVKVINADGIGTAADIVEGLLYAADHGAQVINMSFGGYTYSETLNDAIQYAHQRNVVIVAAAGNEATATPAYPAAFPNVLAVTATAPDDQKWPEANYGSHVALAAPGVGILTTTNNGGYGYGTGTSHAAAMVSGVAALLKAKDARYSNVQIEKQLQASADDLGVKGRDTTFGAGRVNAFHALSSSP